MNNVKRYGYLSGDLEKEQEGKDKDYSQPDSKPIEPEEKKSGKPALFKWLFFLFAIIYVLLSYYHAPLLTLLGRYLIVAHEPQKSDLIVCLSGGNIERGLSTADAYEKKLAPRILITREEVPDGFELLREKGLQYPESVDLLAKLLEELGVPRSALYISDRIARSTVDEATIVRDLVKKEGYKSLIIITSPTHSRRAWYTFKRFLENEDVRILVLPSKYSKFRPEDWWKERKYVREVIIEYEKLIYYTLKYLW